MLNFKDFFLEWAKQEGVLFTMKGSSITASDVFSTRGLMPAIAKRADKTCQLVFGHGLGVSFKKYDASTLGEEVHFSDSEPFIIQLYCLFYAVDDLVRSSSNNTNVVSVDELLYE